MRDLPKQMAYWNNDWALASQISEGSNQRPSRQRREQMPTIRAYRKALHHLTKRDAHYARKVYNPLIAHLEFKNTVAVQTEQEGFHQLLLQSQWNRRAKWSVVESQRDMEWTSTNSKRLQCLWRVINSPHWGSHHLWHLPAWANSTK